jgi:hypothetical protein
MAERPRLSEQWEYKLLPGSGKQASEIEAELNEFGHNGWEVAAYLSYQTLGHIVLKRRRRPDARAARRRVEEP